MTGFNFADTYKAAGFSPGPEIIRLRQEPFEKLRKRVDAPIAVSLARLYFGLPIPDGTDWFRDAFAETDPSFTLLDNSREAAVLASCLLGTALEDGKTAAGLAALAASAAGNRVPLVRPELLRDASEKLTVKAIGSRQRALVDPKEIKPPPKSDVPGVAEQLAQTSNWTTVADLFKKVSNQSLEGMTNVANQAQRVLLPLVEETYGLREDVEMLWWYIGAWSRVLERPFGDLEPALAAAMAGLDLARLAKGSTGPAAAPALLQRLISTCHGARPENVTITEAVDPFPADAFERLELGDALKRVPDICPVLTAFSKASEMGQSPAWHASFKKNTQLEPSTAFHPLALAMQVYRETLLLKLLQ